MLPELFSSVKNISVCHQGTAVVCSECCGDVHHFRIEFADPLHFVIVVKFLCLYYIDAAFYYYIRINAFPLPFRNNSEYKTGEFAAFFCCLYP